jgi:hypothetical protein
MPAEAVVVPTGGSRATRRLRAAENDLRTFEYALGKNAAALEHHNAVKVDLQKQLEAAKETLALRQKELDAETEAAQKAEAKPE